MSSFNILHIIIGFIGLIVIALPFSENAKIINYKYILYGILSQVILALLLLKVSLRISVGIIDTKFALPHLSPNPFKVP